MFTEATSSVTGNGQPKMHLLAGYCGQLVIDWVGKSVWDSSLGVMWPTVYWWWLYTFLALLGVGAVTQRQLVKTTALGRWLRTPLALLCASGDKKYVHAPTNNGARADWMVLHFFSTWATLSVNELLLVLVYVVVFMILGIFYTNAAYNAITRPTAYVLGHLAVLHLTAACLPVTRYSLWLPLLNVDYEVAVEWHRRIGRFGIFLTLAHGVDMAIVNFRISDLFSTASATSSGGASLFGTLCFVCFVVLFATSLEYVRRKFYEWFYNCHLVLAPLGLFFACLHSVQMRYLLIAPAALWALDMGARVLSMLVVNPATDRATLKRASVYRDGAVSLAHLELTWPRASTVADMKTYAGGFFWVLVPDVSSVQWHPISISSAFPPPPTSLALSSSERTGADMEMQTTGDKPAASQEPTFSLHLLAQASGEWTNVLTAHILALAAPEASSAPTSVAHLTGAKASSLKVRVFGPIANRDLSVLHFRTIVLVAGGVGVTPCTSVLDTLLRMRNAGAAAQSPGIEQQRVHLVWASQSEQALTDWFAPLMARAIAAAPHVTLHLYHTRAREAVVRGALRLNAGRPDVAAILDAAVAEASGDAASCGVLTCGPQALMDAAESAAVTRGCHFHREGFAT